MAVLLPDLTARAVSWDDERYLFAQLLDAAPAVTVSWHRQDAVGEATAPSSLPDPWRRDAVEEQAPSPLAVDGPRRLRPLAEELVVHALHGGRAALARLAPWAHGPRGYGALSVMLRPMGGSSSRS